MLSSTARTESREPTDLRKPRLVRRFMSAARDCAVAEPAHFALPCSARRSGVLLTDLLVRNVSGTDVVQLRVKPTTRTSWP